MTEFRFLNGVDATRYTEAASRRLLAANLAAPALAGGTDSSDDGYRSHDLIRRQIVTLQSEHRALDLAVAKLLDMITQRPNELELRRLKKRKLQLKDKIATLQMRLTPDILA